MRHDPVLSIDADRSAVGLLRGESRRPNDV